LATRHYMHHIYFSNVETGSEKLSTHLFLRARLWPVLEQPLDDLLREGGVLLQKLHYAVGELRVVERQASHLVQRDQHLDEELLVLGLEGQRKSVDDRAEDLEELAHAVKVLSLVDESGKRAFQITKFDEGACITRWTRWLITDSAQQVFLFTQPSMSSGVREKAIVVRPLTSRRSC
jgi:hypothetical protein